MAEGGTGRQGGRTALGVLRETFGFEGFLPHQAEIVDAALAGRDVMAVMPTSAGKSVCYQVPALMLDGLAVVVSPLISLMADQVTSLLDLGVAAACLTSAQDAGTRRRTLDAAAEGALDLLYVAPERLDDPLFLSMATQRGVALLAVDEAHCISQWGNDFRPSYQRIIEFIRALPTRPPVMALTATATRAVREDIEASLALEDPLRVLASFDRPNLTFLVERPDGRREKDRALRAFLRERPTASGIVYCSSRRAVEEVCEALCAAGIPATRYHAGLAPDERARNQEDFLYDRRRVMVATNAFGMGIDKSNVSFVVHYNLPLSPENYYQEAGRAGRDGTAATCLLLYTPGDVHTAEFLVSRTERDDLTPEQLAQARERDEERLRQMVFYCTTTDCLRAFMLRYFGEEAPAYCGNCSNCNAEFSERDATTDALKVVSCVARISQRNCTAGAQTIVDVLRGSRNQRVLARGFESLSTYGIMAESSAREVRALIDELVFRGILARSAGDYPVVTLGPSGVAFMRREPPFDEPLVVKVAKGRPRRERAERRGGSFGGSGSSAAALHGASEVLFEELRAVRTELARAQHVPPYIVCSNATLEDMCEKLPRTPEELAQVSGMGANKVRRYGKAFLQAIADHRG